MSRAPPFPAFSPSPRDNFSFSPLKYAMHTFQDFSGLVHSEESTVLGTLYATTLQGYPKTMRI